MRIYIILFFIFLWIPPAMADSITAKVQEQYNKLDSFQAEFIQKLTNAATKQSEARSGNILFKKPKLIRWQTNVPEKELLIVGEKKVWDYFEEEEIVYTYDTSQIFNSKTMLRFISGEADLERDFKIENQGHEQGLVKIKLIPKEPEPNLVLAYIWVDESLSLVRRVLLVDFFGNGNELQMDNIQLNSVLNSTQFNFIPPPGAIVQ